MNHIIYCKLNRKEACPFSQFINPIMFKEQKLNNDINTLKRLILDKDAKILNINKITSDIENLSTEITHLQSAIVLNKEKIDNSSRNIR